MNVRQAQTNKSEPGGLAKNPIPAAASTENLFQKRYLALERANFALRDTPVAPSQHHRARREFSLTNRALRLDDVTRHPERPK